MDLLVDDIIRKNRCKKRDATHFVIEKSGQARFFVSLSRNGKRNLAKHATGFSIGLRILLRMLPWIPLNLLLLIKLGYYCRLSLSIPISCFINSTLDVKVLGLENEYNVLVGTYTPKQKLVLQCSNNDVNLYFKIGNMNSNSEILSEIEFLKKKTSFKSFAIPKFVSANRINQFIPYNILVTEEFSGKIIEAELNINIVRIAQEISKESIEVDGESLYFSHGDFAPWNIRQLEGDYIVFDWEYCGFRFYGYDLIHFLYQINNKLKDMKPQEALSEAISHIIDLKIDLKSENSFTLYKKYIEYSKYIHGSEVFNCEMY